MASVNGVEIQNIKGFKDRDGLTIFQGTVVIDGTVQGAWSMDYKGGTDHYDFDTTELQKRTNQYFDGIPNGLLYPDIFKDTDIFLAQVLDLQDCENRYKEVQITPVIITKDGFMNYIISGFNAKTHTALLQRYEDPERLFIPNSLDCFNLVVDKEHPAPKFWFSEEWFV